MSVKRECRRTIARQVMQDPDGKVKAELLESQCPIRNLDGPGKMVETRWGLEIATFLAQR